MDDKGSICKYIDGPSVLKKELHVPRQELERKFEIVLLTESARTELKKVVQKKADTHPELLHQVSSQSKQN